jgi:hypothetical protein
MAKAMTLRFQVLRGEVAQPRIVEAKRKLGEHGVGGYGIAEVARWRFKMLLAEAGFALATCTPPGTVRARRRLPRARSTAGCGGARPRIGRQSMMAWYTNWRNSSRNSRCHGPGCACVINTATNCSFGSTQNVVPPAPFQK